MEGGDRENNQLVNKNPTREHYYFKYMRHSMKLLKCEFKGYKKILSHAAPETSESYENIVSDDAVQAKTPPQLPLAQRQHHWCKTRGPSTKHSAQV